MAFQFAPSTNVNQSAFNAPQTGQQSKVNGNLLSTLGNLTTIEQQQQALKKAEATFESDVIKSKADAGTAQIGEKSAGLDFGNKTLNTVYTVISPYASDKRVLQAEKLTPQSSKQDIDNVRNGLLDIGEESIKELVARGIPKAEAYRLVAPHFMETEKDPMMAAQSIKMTIQKLAGAANIADQNQQRFGTNAANQTTSIIPAQGDRSYQVLGGQPNANPNPSSAQVSMTNDQAKAYGSDFTASQKDASEALPRIALFQNIKKLAPEAFTGVGGARKELATGVANAFGIDIYTAEKTATDELAKNSALLASVGGNTDAARLLAEAANPNKKMTKEAINEVADQMIGVEKLKQAKVKFLTPFANDPQKYAEALNTFNEVNDFRIFQEATPEQVRRLKSSMSKQAQDDMSRKIARARQLGLL